MPSLSCDTEEHYAMAINKQHVRCECEHVIVGRKYSSRPALYRETRFPHFKTAHSFKTSRRWFYRSSLLDILQLRRHSLSELPVFLSPIFIGKSHAGLTSAIYHTGNSLVNSRSLSR